MAKGKLSRACAAIVLAAGKGTRMRSDLPKVLHPLAGGPLIEHVLSAAQSAGCDPIVVVTAPGSDTVHEAAQSAYADCRFAIQEEQLGTGHAVLSAKDSLGEFDGHYLVLFGDTPLIEADTLTRMIAMLDKQPDVAVVVLAMNTPTPGHYGRLVIAEGGVVERIVEYKDATDAQRAITLCNSGVMAVRGNQLFDLVEVLGNQNASGEYYLTDIVQLARQRGLRTRFVEAPPETLLGINSRMELAEAERMIQQRLRHEAMENGATLIDPSTVYISADTHIGRDVVIHPFVVIGPEVTIGDGVEVLPYCHIEGAVIADGARIGPFARLRPGSGIGEKAHIGNFVEIKKSQVERGAKINHLAYVGDAYVGENANIGAGAITCNFDGYHKYHTHIGKNAFIGSNASLVAPVVVGDSAIVGAGSVVTEDVDSEALAITRPAQTNKQRWAKKFRDRKQNKH